MNINHILEALQKLGFENHIKQLKQELNLNTTDEALELGQNEVDEMKEKINLKKKKKKDRKKNDIEFNEELKIEQQRLFEQSRIEAYNILYQGKVQENIDYGHKTLVEDNFISGNRLVEEENYD